MGCCNGEGSPINSFAVVSYLPEPLAGFLNRLRNEIVTDCEAKAHLTVLPPRPLLFSPDDAWRELVDSLHDFQPIRVELGRVEIFPVTQVLYLSIRAGRGELKRLHHALNRGRLSFEEPFTYHPHVTLAQELEPGQVPAAIQLAETRWRNFEHPRAFTVDRLTFVQNTLENRWTDLHGCALSTQVTI